MTSPLLLLYVIHHQFPKRHTGHQMFFWGEAVHKILDPRLSVRPLTCRYRVSPWCRTDDGSLLQSELWGSSGPFIISTVPQLNWLFCEVIEVHGLILCFRFFPAANQLLPVTPLRLACKSTVEPLTVFVGIELFCLVLFTWGRFLLCDLAEWGRSCRTPWRDGQTWHTGKRGDPYTQFGLFLINKSVLVKYLCLWFSRGLLVKLGAADKEGCQETR